MAKKISVQELLKSDTFADQVAALSFEQGLTLLEELVEQVEGGELALEESVSAYERGVSLLGHLRQLISGAEKKLETLQKSAAEKKTKKSG